MNFAELNQTSRAKAVEAFLTCCGSSRWAEKMADRRPYDSVQDLFRFADSFWWNLSAEDWLEAFAAHPRIGDLDSLREKFKSTNEWAGREQSGVREASDDVLQRLARGNADYEDKFGYIFIVCATGKSAGEMLELLERRLMNVPDEEIRNAAEEQRKITQLRLKKLIT